MEPSTTDPFVAWIIETLAKVGYRVWDQPCMTGTRMIRAVGVLFQCSVIYRDGDRIDRRRAVIRLAKTLGFEVPEVTI